jgi:hypothetical protein
MLNKQNAEKTEKFYDHFSIQNSAFSIILAL